MKPFISVPRQALADLLHTSGSPLTPEQFVAALPDTGAYRKYPGRAWAAAFNKYFLLVVAVLSVVFLPILGFTLENIIIVAGLITVTSFEYRVHRYFRENDPRAPNLGFRNQSAFAAAILIYCLYHAFGPLQISTQDMTLIEQNNLIDASTLKSLTRVFYLSIAIIAGGSQFALAWYYRNAQTAPTQI
jgi:hypothetical protein